MRILQIDKNHPLIRTQLQEKGFEVDEDFTSDYHSIVKKIKNYNGLIIRSRIPIDEAFLNEASHLDFIARVGAGMENIAENRAKELGIALINSPEGNKDAVGEHVLAGLLTLMNRLFIASSEVKSGIWLREENRGEELKGKTFGIIGYGNMGNAVAKRLSSFECTVIFYDIRQNLSNEYARQVSLKELQERSDILSLHTPLTPLTHYMIDDAFISKMKKPFYFVNTARGKNLKTASLVSAIKSGKVKGAYLDVLEYEKSSFENLDFRNEDLDFLLNSEKVIVTPHIAGWTHESKVKLAQFIVDKILLQFGN